MPDSADIFFWHFIVFDLKDCAYEGGYYHGTIKFPPEYPNAPPEFKMLTPSGRFEVNKPICFSFSNYHPELWNHQWTIETIMVGLISFMTTEENSAGVLHRSKEERKTLAANSLEYNLTETSNPLFTKAFDHKLLQEIGIFFQNTSAAAGDVSGPQDMMDPQDMLDP